MSFKGSKGAFVNSFNKAQRFHWVDFWKLLGQSLLKTGEKPVELRALRDVESHGAQGVNNSRPVAICG